MTTTTMSTAISKPIELPEPVVRRGISHAQWLTLRLSLYPGAQENSVYMVWDYCKARGLDPLKKPCHIVPMEVTDARTGEKTMRDVVMPGIYEYRTTAQRTGAYLGHTRPEYGPVDDFYGVAAPAWCELVIYRHHPSTGTRAEYPVRVYFAEAVATYRDRKTGATRVNRQWTQRPIQMLTKCTEAAGLREAFPDELGGEATAEEMAGQRATVEAVPTDERPTLPRPEGYTDFLGELTDAAEAGAETLEAAFAAAEPTYRGYLTAADAGTWEVLKARAASATAAAASGPATSSEA